MRVEIYLLMLVLATGSALLFGTRGERWLGATVLGGNVFTVLLERYLGETFASVSLGYLALDAVLAVILCLIAIRFPSWVSICVSAFQINGTLGHLVKLLAHGTIPFSYAFLLKFWAWPMLLVLLAGRWLPAMHTPLLARDFPPFVRRA
ncbi:MAG TPA: hypothetical protein VGU01_05325 [Sphingomicrobium sp.]|nr:hypothetical protein [Sphingomicrobium sp.]